jgi:hypothetical protein
VSHISVQQDLSLNELELFLNTKRAAALDNILDWWKVSTIFNFFNLLYKLLIYYYYRDMQLNFHILLRWQEIIWQFQQPVHLPKEFFQVLQV